MQLSLFGLLHLGRSKDNRNIYSREDSDCLRNPLHRSSKKSDNMVTRHEKQELRKQLVACLRSDTDIRKVVIFGSFITSREPRDMDVAVFQESSKGYVELSMKYRKLTRPVSRRIPVDIFPIRAGMLEASILREIDNGEVIYER